MVIDFDTAYQRMQQNGNTLVSLLNEFEGDIAFTDAFQKQFEKAPLIPDVHKYLNRFYSDEEIEAGIREANNMVKPKTSPNPVAADTYAITPFESRVCELHTEFYTLVGKKETPEDCFTHNIIETNIYKQFRSIEYKFNDFKKLKSIDISANILQMQVEQYGNAIVSDIEAIEYEPICNKVIEAIINDKSNIYSFILHRNDKDFAGNYATAKMYLNNYLNNYLKEHQKKVEAPQPNAPLKIVFGLDELYEAKLQSFNNDDRNTTKIRKAAFIAALWVRKYIADIPYRPNGKKSLLAKIPAKKLIAIGVTVFDKDFTTQFASKQRDALERETNKIIKNYFDK